MTALRFVAGAALGTSLGYAAHRSVRALRELREPAPVREPDARAYGALRRELMLGGMARSLAMLGGVAYGLGPLLERRRGARESRARRIAISAIGMLATSVLDLPIDFVEGYALERTFALTKQTPRAWFADRAKMTLVSLVVSVPLIEILASIIERAPRTWPLLATGGTAPLLVLANIVVPNVVMPLFNSFVPIEGELEADLRALAARYDAGDAAILRVDMSKQTEKANAYVTGLFGSKRIVLGDTLLAHFDEREIVFVVAHELGHYVTKDVWRSVGLGTAAAAIVFFGGRRLALRRGELEGSSASTASLARLAFWMSVLGTLLGPALSAMSRSRERAADEFALEATGDAAGGAAAFARLRDRNMAEDEQPKWMEVLFSSHPSLRSRIERLEGQLMT